MRPARQAEPGERADTHDPVSLDLDLPGEQVAAESRADVRVFVPNQKVVAKKIRKHWEGLGEIAASYLQHR